jgi:hypothetical protein
VSVGLKVLNLLQLCSQDGQGVVAQEVNPVKVTPTVCLAKTLQGVEHIVRFKSPFDVQEYLECKVENHNKECNA